MPESSDGTATTTSKTFSRETRIATTIDAPPSTVWRLLTNAKDYPAWNSTIVSMNGEIAPGSKIELVSTWIRAVLSSSRSKFFKHQQALLG